MKKITLVLLCLALAVSTVNAEKFSVKKTEKGLDIHLNGKLFTSYLKKSGAKPILYPVYGPGNVEYTRGFPMRAATKDERNDHIHHRSFWLTHGDVNGIDFWSESGKNGNIIHRGFERVEGGDTAVIVSTNDWIAPDGSRVCADKRTLTFGASNGQRWIDFDAVITATDGPVKFGDTKEGSFGVRVAGTMKVDSKKGGRIINSEGQTDRGAWGKRAPWVDYNGPVDGKTVGVAILNHPKSFRYPTHWHVRTYGLFTANSFGLHHFLGDKKADGSHTLKKGESIEFHFRVIFHKGDEKAAAIARAFSEYAKAKK